MQAPDSTDAEHHRHVATIDFPPDALRRLAKELDDRWKCYRKALKRCQRKFSEKVVHQFRVETRRLLSRVDLLTPFSGEGLAAEIRKCLKRNLDSFDALRDTQVQLLRVRECRKKYFAAGQFYSWLEKFEKRCIRRAHRKIDRIKTKRVRKWIRASGRQARMREKLRAAGENNALLLGAVDGAFRRTVELMDRIDAKRTETIHHTRVAFKKFRYMFEAIASLVPQFPSDQLDAMHEYQTLMGDVQDLEVLRLGFEKFAREEGLKRAEAAAFLKELRRRRETAIKIYLNKAHSIFKFRAGLPELNGHPPHASIPARAAVPRKTRT